MTLLLFLCNAAMIILDKMPSVYPWFFPNQLMIKFWHILVHNHLTAWWYCESWGAISACFAPKSGVVVQPLSRGQLPLLQGHGDAVIATGAAENESTLPLSHQEKMFVEGLGSKLLYLITDARRIVQNFSMIIPDSESNPMDFCRKAMINCTRNGHLMTVPRTINHCFNTTLLWWWLFLCPSN